MSEGVAIINEQALFGASDALRKYAEQCYAILQEALHQLSRLSGNWQDDDYRALEQAISSLSDDIQVLEDGARFLVNRINQKLAAIRELRNIKI